MRMGTTKQSEKSKVFTTNRWSYGHHYNMVSLQNGDTRGGPPPPFRQATPLPQIVGLFLVFIDIWQEDVANIF